MPGLSQDQFTQLQALESEVLKIKYLDIVAIQEKEKTLQEKEKTLQEKEKTRQRELELFGIYLA